MTDSSVARDRLRSMALSLATGSGPIVDPRSFDAAIDAYGDARLAEQPADVASEVSLLRAAIGRGRRLARAFEVSGNEFIADQIRTALELDEPANAPSAPADITPYRRLLARLEADRAGHMRAAGQTTDETLRTAGSSYAAALHQAAVAAVTMFEGAEAAQEYAQRTSGGEAGAGDGGAADLRERVRRACAEADGARYEELEPWDYQTHADKVLAVLGAPVDRAAVLREAADMIYAEFTGPDLDRYARYAAGYLRRMADEAQPAGEGQ